MHDECDWRIPAYTRLDGPVSKRLLVEEAMACCAEGGIDVADKGPYYLAGAMSRSVNPRAAPAAEVVALPIQRTDAELVQGLRRGEPWARAVLVERLGPLVERIVRRILGDDRHTERVDVVHDAFVAAFASVHTLKAPEALVSWMQSVATHTACKAIRRRKARSWLRFVAPEDLPESPAPSTDDEAQEAHRRTYEILERFSAGERAIFALRFIDGLGLAEVAQACGVSLATAKRRLARAQRRFVAAAFHDPVLSLWLRKGERWTV